MDQRMCATHVHENDDTRPATPRTPCIATLDGERREKREDTGEDREKRREAEKKREEKQRRRERENDDESQGCTYD